MMNLCPQSRPPALVTWKLPEGRKCKVSPPEADPNRCYFTPIKSDFGRLVSCVASNPISKKAIEQKMVLNTLHYQVNAACHSGKDEFGNEQVL